MGREANTSQTLIIIPHTCTVCCTWCVTLVHIVHIPAVLVYWLTSTDHRTHADILSIFSQSCLFCFYYCSILLVDRVLVHSSTQGLHWPLHKVVQLAHTSSAVHSSEYQVYSDSCFLLKWSAQDAFHHVAVICFRLSTNHCLLFHWNDSTCAPGVWLCHMP